VTNDSDTIGNAVELFASFVWPQAVFEQTAETITHANSQHDSGAEGDDTDRGPM
jgi:hypothetical protein